ncbi:hypothetical protein BDV34DRAFT_228962 [Aspergillus parasiticus]|uniref:Uncharacterized protein n=1 Tax=Aspergillus parasiticus TaxID=5067 RepID=A0A5N6DCD6_ASPPA|nr:hypothetical protein BDV34DRAFT_228962 [Aspergillus parasiticus]
MSSLIKTFSGFSNVTGGSLVINPSSRQLANYWTREKVPKYGVPQHIIRISVGLEDSESIVNAVAVALHKVERFESGDVLLGDA